jgi:hypothetical protein
VNAKYELVLTTTPFSVQAENEYFLLGAAVTIRLVPDTNVPAPATSPVFAGETESAIVKVAAVIWKFATRLRLAFTGKVYEAEVLTTLPFSVHPVNANPALGAAFTVALAPATNEPAPVAVPPFAGLTDVFTAYEVIVVPGTARAETSVAVGVPQPVHKSNP